MVHGVNKPWYGGVSSVGEGCPIQHLRVPKYDFHLGVYGGPNQLITTCGKFIPNYNYFMSNHITNVCNT